MAKLTRADVLKLARLARLHVTEDEVEQYVEEISAVLGYVDQLQNIDLDGLEPTNQVTGLTNVMRADVPWDYGYNRDDLLKNLPDQKDGQIKVKRMLT